MSSEDARKTNGVAIIGGGIAGLATAWRLQEQGIPYKIYEKTAHLGGNARTERWNEFLYDLGPHRFHDKLPEVTEQIRALLGSELLDVVSPSEIRWDGGITLFPLKPLQIIRSTRPRFAAGIASEILWRLICRPNLKEVDNFADFARKQYGRRIAETFLLPYSRKLWGAGPEHLSTQIASSRMPGYTLRSVLSEMIMPLAHSRQTEGRFLYPRRGFGQIAQRLASVLSPGTVAYRCELTAVKANQHKITELEFSTPSGALRLQPAFVVTTVPISRFVAMMRPAESEPVRCELSKLRYRNVVLVALFLHRQAVGNAAVTYFPSAASAFTRVHEPRNRSRLMSPPGYTSLIVEYPCFQGDATWGQDDDALMDYTVSQLAGTGMIQESEVIGAVCHRMANCYPQYVRGFEESRNVLLDHLSTFRNLWSVGRCSNFTYSHVHTHIGEANAAVLEIKRMFQCGPPEASREIGQAQEMPDL